jgi:hypothetical protein
MINILLGQQLKVFLVAKKSYNVNNTGAKRIKCVCDNLAEQIIASKFITRSPSKGYLITNYKII